MVRKALVCEKVNVYTVDTMRQELLAYAHLTYQDDIAGTLETSLQKIVLISFVLIQCHDVVPDCNATLYPLQTSC